MKTFRDWFEKNYPNEKYPTGSVSGQWFANHGIPMIVACTCCEMTMTAPSALLDDEGQVFCSGCGELEENEEVVDEYTLADLGNNWY